MIFDARDGILYIDGVPQPPDFRASFIDLDTGKPIRWVRRADTTTGQYEAFRTDPAIAASLNLQPTDLLYTGKTRLRFIPYRVQGKPRSIRALRASRQCVSDPCSFVPSPNGTPILMIPGRECEIPGCHKRASWKTQDVEEIEPEETTEPRGGVRACKRLQNVRTHFFCSWCYRFPVQTSRRGVENEVQVKARPE